MAKVRREIRPDENLITLDTQEAGENESAILEAIKKREIELKTELLKTRQEAEAIISKARAEATNFQEKAKTSGKDKGVFVRPQELDTARKQASELAEGIERKKEELLASGRNNMDQAVDFVVGAVLPGTGKEVVDVIGNDQDRNGRPST